MASIASKNHAQGHNQPTHDIHGSADGRGVGENGPVTEPARHHVRREKHCSDNGYHPTQSTSDGTQIAGRKSDAGSTQHWCIGKQKA